MAAYLGRRTNTMRHDDNCQILQTELILKRFVLFRGRENQLHFKFFGDVMTQPWPKARWIANPPPESRYRWVIISYSSRRTQCLIEASLPWRNNGRDTVSNHQPHDCLLNRLFKRRSKKISKPRVTGLCAGNSPGNGEFPAQMTSNAENVSIWWRHHVILHAGLSQTFVKITFNITIVCFESIPASDCYSKYVQDTRFWCDSRVNLLIHSR